jgi:hypothetical protein
MAYEELMADKVKARLSHDEKRRASEATHGNEENTAELDWQAQAETLSNEYDTARLNRDEMNLAINRVREQWQAKMELHTLRAQGLRDQAVVHEQMANDIREFLFPSDKDKVAGDDESDSAVRR